MDNKILGIIVIAVSILLWVMLVSVMFGINKAYQPQIDKYEGGSCPSDPDLCPHVQRSRAYYPVYFGFGIALLLLSLGIYLIFFEKGQKAILDTLKETKEIKLKEDKFDILLKGLDEHEKKSLIKKIKKGKINHIFLKEAI